MTVKDHRDAAQAVIAEAEKAVAQLRGTQDARADRLLKLHELFTVVEQRYQAQQQDLAERDEHIRVLTEANEDLTRALRALADAANRTADHLDEGDNDLLRAVERSETLVARAFGTGGNANPTQSPDAPPASDALDQSFVTDESGEATDSDRLLDTDFDVVGGGLVEPDARDEGLEDLIEDLEMGRDGEVCGAGGVVDAAIETESENWIGVADKGADDDVLAFEDDNPEASGPEASGDDGDGAERSPGDGIGSEETREAVEDGHDGDADAAVPADLDGPGGDGADEAGETEEPLIRWSESWSVGAPEMDRDHRILINLINQLPAALSKAPERGWIVGSVMNSLWDYTEYHFDREEALQKAANFPGAEDHASRHQELKRQVRDWLDRYQADPEAMDGPALLAFLKGWLTNHILGEDMRYKPYVQNNPDAQAVAAAIKVDPDLIEDLGDAANIMEPAV